MLVAKTKCFPVCKALDRSHLVQENEIVVLQIEVNRIQVLLENLIVNDIDAALLQPHVHDSTKNFEQVLKDILLGIVIEMFHVAAEGDPEFASLHSDVIR